MNNLNEDEEKENFLVKLSCGHQVQADKTIFDYIPSHKVPVINCTQCDNEIINGTPAVDIRKHYSNVVGVKDFDKPLRDVLNGVPLIMFDKLVYVSIEQSREFNGGL